MMEKMGVKHMAELVRTTTYPSNKIINGCPLLAQSGRSVAAINVRFWDKSGHRDKV